MFSLKVQQKWKKTAKCKERFLTKYKEWMEVDLEFCFTTHEEQPSTSSGRVSGRPQKEFDTSCSKTKKRKVEDLVTTRSTAELISAAEISARKSGLRNVASGIKSAGINPKKCGLGKPKQRCLKKEEALAYYVEAKCTSHSYKQTRKWSLKAGHEVYPSYYSVQKAKNDCYTPENKITVNESGAKVELQAILNKTIERLFASQVDAFKNLSSCASFTLFSKWGCDGSSGHSTYKQKFEKSDQSDEFLFVFSFVPLRLVTESGIVAWQNPRPSSTMFCRPIKFIFSKETTAFTISETNEVLKEIEELQPTKVSIFEREVSVNHELLLTMVDGKICNALTETSSSQKCYICGATPAVMNDEKRTFLANRNNLGFGLSTLHAWIRSFECLLHISYRIDIKKWQVRDVADKNALKKRSSEIKEKFKSEMGLIVDKPKPGYGNSNDGNTARNFFKNSDKSAEITGLDVSLINKFYTILRVLSSGYDINIEKFEKFANETRHLYLSLYSWYYMPVTVHKILIHSAEVIKSALLPIGQLSEEAQEARHKDCRRFREHHTQKTSRSTTNRDLLNMLFITSDPVINSHRELPKKGTGNLPSEVLDLLLLSTNNTTTGADTVNNCSEVESTDSD